MGARSPFAGMESGDVPAITRWQYVRFGLVRASGRGPVEASSTHSGCSNSCEGSGGSVRTSSARIMSVCTCPLARTSGPLA